jgi:predicted transposase/invertase (TIGR01784 family)
VKNSSGELIIIEVQQNSESDYFQRMVYASSKLTTEQLRKGEDYDKIKHVISINIFYFNLGQGEDYIYKGTTKFQGLHNGSLLQLSETQKKLYFKNHIHQLFPEYYIIKVNNFDNIAKDSLDEWVYFLKNSDIKDGFSAKGIQKAKEELNLLKLTEQEQLEYEGFLHNRRVRNNEIETALYDGRQEGMEEGIDIGENKKAKNVAIKLIEKGFPDAEIADITGLSIKEISELRELIG